jgi:Bacteriophage tail sheath protein
MPTVYQTPGVYINEVASGAKPIEGVATSVAAFVGLAPGGPVNVPKKVTSWIEFARTFSDETPPGANGATPPTTNGPYMEGAYLAHAVNGFFANGGSICYVVRIGSNLHGGVPQKELPSTTSEPPGLPAYTVLRLQQDSDTDPVKRQLKPVADWEPVTVKFESETAGGSAKKADGPQPPETFKATVTLGDGKPPEGAAADENPNLEEYTGLSAKPGARYFASVINATSRLVQVADPDANYPFSARIFDLSGEALSLVPPEAPASPTYDTLEGDAATGTGLYGLEGIDEITMVCVPDLMALTDDLDAISAVQQKVEEYCVKGKRMAIHDSPPALDKQEIAVWRASINIGSAFSTLYWPWVRVTDPVSKGVIEVPPCGHVAGVWAGTDNRRGVQKAPANEVVTGVVGLATQISNPDQESLNTAGINVIRQFPGRGIRIWGARTLATKTDPDWRYINVRRLFNYVSASILEGTSWAVFEPNDEVLWAQLRVSVGNFLTGVWRGGALFGASPGEAFFVKCDRDTNPQDAIDAGQVNIQVGIAPVKPAEFVIFQISQYQPVA